MAMAPGPWPMAVAIRHWSLPIVIPLAMADLWLGIPDLGYPLGRLPPFPAFLNILGDVWRKLLWGWLGRNGSGEMIVVGLSARLSVSVSLCLCLFVSATRGHRGASFFHGIVDPATCKKRCKPHGAPSASLALGRWSRP